MVCPNCDSYLSKDEQLIIIPSGDNKLFSVDHVSIYSEGSIEIKIDKKCNSQIYTTLSIN